MERLTKPGYKFNLLNVMQGLNTHTEVDEVLNRLAAYEDAEEQGLLVRWPCKVGDSVFYIRRVCKHADDTGYCNTYFWYAKKGVKKENGCCNCPHEVLENRIKETTFRLALMDGKRIGHLHISECYFTRAEAEEALKGAEHDK